MYIFRIRTAAEASIMIEHSRAGGDLLKGAPERRVTEAVRYRVRRESVCSGHGRFQVVVQRVRVARVVKTGRVGRGVPEEGRVLGSEGELRVEQERGGHSRGRGVAEEAAQRRRRPQQVTRRVQSRRVQIR